MRVKASITLQEKLLIIHALRFIQAFVAEDAQRFDAQKNSIAKAALGFYFRKKLFAKDALCFTAQKNLIAKVALRFYLHKILIAKVALGFNTRKNQIALVALRFNNFESFCAFLRCVSVYSAKMPTSEN